MKLRNAITLFYIRTEKSRGAYHLEPKDKKVIYLSNMQLHPNDFTELQDITTILNIFKRYTGIFEGRKGNAWEVLPSIFHIRDNLKEQYQCHTVNLAVSLMLFRGGPDIQLPSLPDYNAKPQNRDAPLQPLQKGLLLAIKRLNKYIALL